MNVKTTLNIEGMSCGHCVRTVKAALSALDGVHSADVSLALGTAEVEHAEAVSAASLVAAVEEKGYTATEVCACCAPSEAADGPRQGACHVG